MAAAAAMATATAPPLPTFSSSSCRKQFVVYSSSPLILPNSRSSKSHLYIANPLLGRGPLSVWSSLKHLGVSFRGLGRQDIKGRCRGRIVYASLFGVGAPEALVIGVVALLVFGPKGLAEVARNLGKTLRAFQPTIRELQDVSREFKSTLEREIGLDEVQSSLRSTYDTSSFVNEKPKTAIDPNGSQPPTKPYSSEDLLKITEEQLASSAAGSQSQAPSAKEQSQDTAGSEEVATATSAAPSTAGVKTAPSIPEVADNLAASDVAVQVPLDQKPKTDR